ncbi:protein FAN-like [Amphiura filiformis]|uniref:protein FAN-like n=1 Tax=Amphiura filiformis TaxID=82378 RepID=UPI003B21B8C3
MAFVSENYGERKERFSLLLLEPSEIYFEDFSVFYYPCGLTDEQAEEKKLRGRLKVCSKSIVFEPQDTAYPVVKFMLRDTSKIEKWTGPLLSRLGNRGDMIMIECRQTIEMMKDNIIGPYEFKKEKGQHRFSLNFVTPDDILHMMCQLHRASTLPLADEAAMIGAIVYSRQNRVSFNTSWLENLYEKIVMETVGDHITPLVVNPGRVMLTSSRLYFQPFNNVEPDPVIKINLCDIKRVVKKRFLLRQVGLEIFCSTDTFKSDMLLVFAKPAIRDRLHDKMLAQSGVSLQETAQENMTLRWQTGAITNQEYLLYLNSQADRSFNDLTQYPVFPWVIADYESPELDLENPATYRDLSKPMGALNPDRLERFKERCQDMPEPKFLYGSHYSTPGYVLYYLNRVAPEYSLCLQNGKFDQPDRQFKSIAETWKNVMSLPSDVKELIPEFYQPEMADFLSNRKLLELGTMQDGSKVNNVELPLWADDELDFCRKCKKALESNYASQYLHEWIDLIFGYKQRGKEAEDSNNLFYYLTYEGAVDLDSVKDPNEKESIKAQIMEFGQTPKQLFTRPHPARFSTPVLPIEITAQATHDESVVETEDDVAISTEAKEDDLEEINATNEVPIQVEASSSSCWDKIEDLKPMADYKLHKDTVHAIKLANQDKVVFSVSQDSQLKLYSLEDQRQLRSVSLSSLPLSCLAVIPDKKQALVGSWDNSVYLYSIDYGRVLDTLVAHDDAVSSLWLRDNLLVTASWDSTVKVWLCGGLQTSCGGKMEAELLAELDHDTGVTCVDVNKEATHILSGTREGAVYYWEISGQSILRHSQNHSSVVHAVKFHPHGHQMLSAGADHYIRVVDVHTGTEVFAKDAGEEIRCLVWHANLLLAGDCTGKLLIWDMVKGQLKTSIKGHEGAISCIEASEDGAVVITGGEDKKIVLWKVS